MASRNLFLLLTIMSLPGCFDFFGGPGDYGSNVASAETWSTVLDEANPRDEFAIRLTATASERTTLNWSEIAVVAGWTASDDAEVDVDVSLGGEMVGSFAMLDAAESYSDAGVVELQRVAPFALELCVEFSLRGTGAMAIEVNGVEYRFDIKEGSDVEVEVAIVAENCE